MNKSPIPPGAVKRVYTIESLPIQQQMLALATLTPEAILTPLPVASGIEWYTLPTAAASLSKQVKLQNGARSMRYLGLSVRILNICHAEADKNKSEPIAIGKSPIFGKDNRL
ncbi:hypothetical protein [Arcticibacter sp. MXS-1]|uniref:hypothetical protein n=1 Tax=Arcticibacter sp. MXS-1 TaxID=3341726 RepID=UPI0035A8A88B